MEIVVLTGGTDNRRFLRYLGPYQIAWWMRENGFSVQVLDFLFFMPKDKRVHLLKKYITQETKVVTIAPFAYLDWHHDSALAPLINLFEEVKYNFPWVKVSVGGQFALNFVRKGVYKKLSYKVDAVFQGAGEHSYLDYCNYVFGKSTAFPKFNFVDNLKVIEPTKEYNIQSCRMRFSKQDFIMPGESLPLELSRGCIFKCAFCQYPDLGKDKDDFNRNMDYVRETLIHNYENFGTTEYYIADDTLNSHRQRTKDLYEISKTLPFKLNFIGYVRLDLLDIWPEQQEILPEAGLVSCHFGVESLDPVSCKQIGKGWGAKNHRIWIPKIAEMWKDTVSIRCSLIAGLGKETEKDWSETSEWFKTTGVKDWFYNLLVLRKEINLSLFEKNPEKYGYQFDSRGNWYTDTMTYYRAKAWQVQNYSSNLHLRYATTWDHAGLRNLGFDKETIRTETFGTLIKKTTSGQLAKAVADRYYEIAINY